MGILSDRSKYAVNPIREEDVLAAQLAEQGKNVIKLNTGDPAKYFKTPKYIIDAYVRALREGKTSYGSISGLKELREAVVERYKRMYGLDADAGDVIVTQGLSEAIAFIDGALINPGDSAILFRPFYPIYMPQLFFYGGKPLFGDYIEEKGWDIDTDSLGKAVKGAKKGRIKYMLVISPNNPTGTMLSRKTLTEIVDFANEHDIFLISDEIYDEITFNNAKFTSITEVAKGVPYMVMNGASKDYDATGFRLGFMLVPGTDKISQKVKSKMVEFAAMRLSANTPAQYAFAEGLRNVREHEKSVKAMVKSISDRINFAAKLINESEYMHVVKPNGAFYLFPKVDFSKLNLRNDKEFTSGLLKEKYVQITRGSGFGKEGYIRIVGLPPKDILEYSINKINEFCREHKKR